MPRILYIAGYSRCGSTILDMMLDSHDRVLSTGELTYLLDDAPNAARMCTCGARYIDCPRYGPWLATRPDGEAEMVRRVEARAGFEALLAQNVPQTDAEAYRDYARSLFGGMAEASGAEIIVDSSKSAKDAAGRPLALARLAGFDVRVLHLSRNPQATIRSYIDKGSNWVLEGHRKARALESFRPIMGWTLANRFAAQVGEVLGPERYMHIRLEDVLADPAAAMGRIGAFAGIDLSGVAEQVLAGAAFTAGHSVGGNRARLKPQTIDLAPPAPKPLPAGHAVGLRLVGARVIRQLGYA